MRAFKKIFYGLFYLAVFAGLILWIYSGWFKPAPSCLNGFKDAGEDGIDCGGVCSKACLPSGLSAIETLGDPKIFHPTASSVSAMAEIQNKNAAFAAQVLPYKFEFYDAGGNLIYEKTGETYIYASEIKYVADFDLRFPGISQVSYAKFSAGEAVWVSDSLFVQPILSVQSSNVSSSASGLQVTGNFMNKGAVTVPHTTVFAIFYSNIGQPAGISKNEVDNVGPGQQSAFSVFHPPLSNINLSATKIFLYGD